MAFYKLKVIGVIFIITLIVADASNRASASEFRLESEQLHSRARLGKAQLYNSFGCDGDNRSPSLYWNNAPPGTRSFAVTMYDPDAPTGSGWWHWIIFNIPRDVTRLNEGAGNEELQRFPKGSIQSKTDFGRPGYGGGCPPLGDRDHRYIFTVYALDIERLNLAEDASGAMVGYFLNRHTIAKAELLTFYSR